VLTAKALVAQVTYVSHISRSTPYYDRGARNIVSGAFGTSRH